MLARFKYYYVHNLIEYYQMETRWSLRRLLIENFMLMCSLEPVVISLMLSSVLPLELAQDLFQVRCKFDFAPSPLIDNFFAFVLFRLII